MGKQAEIEPRWLVSLMCRWATRERPRDNGHVGWYNQSAFLTVGRATSGYADPTGFCAEDFRELDAALQDLQEAHLGQYMAMMMYYKPWAVGACRAEGWPFADSTYYKRLHAAHARVSAFIDKLRGFKKKVIDATDEVE